MKLLLGGLGEKRRLLLDSMIRQDPSDFLEESSAYPLDARSLAHSLHFAQEPYLLLTTESLKWIKASFSSVVRVSTISFASHVPDVLGSMSRHVPCFLSRSPAGRNWNSTFLQLQGTLLLCDKVVQSAVWPRTYLVVGRAGPTTR